MNKIFIEAQSKRTPEYHFIKAIIKSYFPDKEVDFICIGGIGNLFNETNINLISQAQLTGEQVVVLTDADTKAKGDGFEKREEDIRKGMKTHQIDFPYFIYPDNQNDGDVEVLMEAAARHDLHTIVFDCFEDYEKCVSGTKDKSGQPLYHTPNLKGKLHTYINAQKLNNKQRRDLGSGNWLFNDVKYWDLSAETLRPLKDFFAKELK